jgi:hypothetical protein
MFVAFMLLHIFSTLCYCVLLYFVLQIETIQNLNLNLNQMNLQNYIEFQKMKRVFPSCQASKPKAVSISFWPTRPKCFLGPATGLSASTMPSREAQHRPTQPSPPSSCSRRIGVGSLFFTARKILVLILSQVLMIGFDFKIRSLGDRVGYEIGTSSPIKRAFPYRLCQNPV